MEYSSKSQVEDYLYFIEFYIKNNYCSGMNLSLLKGTKVVDPSKLPQNVDARTENTIVLISSQAIQNAMKVVSITNLNSYLEKAVTEMCYEIRHLLNILFHEFCHLNEQIIMPHIHNILFYNPCPLLNKLVAHFWIEFVVSCKSNEKHFTSTDKLIQSFLDMNWDIKYLKDQKENPKDLGYLLYTMPYFISACYTNSNFENFAHKICNDNAKSLTMELYVECVNLYSIMPFDDYGKLEILASIIKKKYCSYSNILSMLCQVT